MKKVVINKLISENSYLIGIEDKDIIKNFIPGQFCIIMAKEGSERIPLTIYDYDNEGIVYLIYQVVGASTLELSKVTDSIYSLSGPLGKPSEICLNYQEYLNKKIIYVAGGVGIAPIYPQVKYLKEKGLSCDIIYGARKKDLLLIRDKIEAISNVTYVTDDGSFGMKGNVCDALSNVVTKYDYCVTIGPVIMMKYVSELTKKYQLKTIVSMNPIMVDGSGMCGACRCMIDGNMKFACIDGPEFDGHQVDFDSALKRLNIYKVEEQEKMTEMKKKLEDHDGR